MLDDLVRQERDQGTHPIEFVPQVALERAPHDPRGSRSLLIRGNGCATQQRLVKRGALAGRAQKALGKTGIRPHLVIHLRVPLGRLNNRKMEKSL